MNANGITSASNASSWLKHHTATIALHWASALLFLAAAATILVRELVEDSAIRTLLVESHRQVGMLVLAAWVARLVVRSIKGMAHTEAGMSLPMRIAAKGAHYALYALILAIPMLGWALSNAHGVQLKFLGMLPLPMITAADSDFADTLTDYHILVSWALLVMVTLHIGAALYHHYVRRDQVLSAMLPGKATADGQTDAVNEGRCDDAIAA